MLTTIALERVMTMPREFSPGTFYVSEEFGVTGHLCACGCGNKVMIPLGPAEWTFTEDRGLPTLHPSVGNWQLPCRSHYVISRGKVVWAAQWTEAQVVAGRADEDRRRQAYYAERARERTLWYRFTKWLARLFGG